MIPAGSKGIAQRRVTGSRPRASASGSDDRFGGMAGVRLPDGTAGFLSREPLPGRPRQGHLLALYRTVDLVRAAVAEARAAGIQVNLGQDAQEAYVDPAWALGRNDTALKGIDADNLNWALHIRATPALIARLRGNLADVVLWGGALLSLLLALAVDRALIARRHARRMDRQQTQIRASEAKYRSLIEAMVEGVTVNQGDRCVFANTEMARLTGYAVEEFAGLQFSALIGPGHLELFAERFRDRTGGSGPNEPPRRYEMQLRRRNGDLVWVELTTHPTEFNGEPAVLTLFRDIEERKAAEAALRSYQERMEMVARGATDGIWDWNIVTGEEYFSDHWFELLGYRAGELPSSYETWTSLLHSEDRDAVIAQVQRHLLLREPYDVECRMQNSDGTFRWYRCAGQATWDSAGRPLRMAGSISDIEERKRAEVALELSESHFRGAMEHAPIGMALVSLDGKWLKLNKALCEIVGYTPAELSLLSLQQITHPDDLNGDLAHVDRLLAGDVEAYAVEKRYIRKDGGPVWVLLAVSLARDKDGQPEFFISQIKDIDQRKRAEAEIARSEAKLRSIVETAPDALVTADSRGLIVAANKATERVFGYPIEDLIGRNISLLMPAGDRVAHDLALAGVRPDRTLAIEGRTRQLTGLRANGQKFPVEVTVGSWTVDGERYVTGVIADISVRKRQESQILDALREKELLLREVYHRVKNNLQVIRSLLNLQARSLPEGPARHAMMETGARIRAMALVHEKLYQSGNLSHISVRDFARELIDQIRESSGLGLKGIRIENDIADVGMGLDTAIPVGLLINELVSNCAKHAFPAGRSGRIRVTLDECGSDVKLSVEDEGIGLPAGFDVNRARSMGLRLAVALARQLGGVLECGSTPEGGARFATLIKSPAEARSAEANRVALPDRESSLPVRRAAG